MHPFCAATSGQSAEAALAAYPHRACSQQAVCGIHSVYEVRHFHMKWPFHLTYNLVSLYADHAEEQLAKRSSFVILLWPEVLRLLITILRVTVSSADHQASTHSSIVALPHLDTQQVLGLIVAASNCNG